MANDNEYDPPRIVSFQTSKSRIKNKEQFRLSWEVEGARTIELYKNGRLLHEFRDGQQSINLQENYDGVDKDIEYTLTAVNDAAKSDSLPVTVRLAEGFHTAADEKPTIKSFTANTYSVTNREQFILTWEVENANDVTVLRNGIIFRKLSADNTSLSSSESYDGRDKEILFSLQATNPAGRSESDKLVIVITEKVEIPEPVVEETIPDPIADPAPEIQLRQHVYKETNKKNQSNIRTYLIGLGLALILAMTLVIFFVLNKPKILDFDPKSTTEGHTVIIVGKNFPKDTLLFQVVFNSVPGHVAYNSSDLIRVIVPNLGEKFGDGKVTIALVYKGDTLPASQPLILTRGSVASSTTVTSGPDSLAIADTPVVATVVVPKIKTQTPKITKPGNDQPVATVKEDVPATVDEPKRPFIDILTMVKVSSDFKRKAIAGVKDLKLTVENDSQFDLDKVEVDVMYIKKNDKEIKNRVITFTDVRAHTKISQDLPGSNRGAGVTFKIKSISSRQLDAAQPQK